MRKMIRLNVSTVTVEKFLEYARAKHSMRPLSSPISLTQIEREACRQLVGINIVGLLIELLGEATAELGTRRAPPTTNPVEREVNERLRNAILRGLQDASNCRDPACHTGPDQANHIKKSARAELERLHGEGKILVPLEQAWQRLSGEL